MTDPSSQRRRGGPGDDANGGRGPLLVGVAMIAFGIVALVALYWPSGAGRGDDDARSTADRPDRPSPGKAQSTRRAVERLPAFARPPFWEEPGPELLDETYDFLTNDTRKLRSTLTKQLYDYGRENPTDARPQLLLAFDDMKRGWWSTAVTHYKLAFDADPRAKQEPRLVRHLAFVAGDPKHGADAVDLLRRIYGTDAEGMIAKEVEQLRAKDDKLARWWLGGIERGLETMQAPP